MKRLLLIAAIPIVLTGCPNPSVISLEAMSDHWRALEPFTLEGIESSTLAPTAKAELARECEIFGKLIKEELNAVRS